MIVTEKDIYIRKFFDVRPWRSDITNFGPCWDQSVLEYRLKGQAGCSLESDESNSWAAVRVVPIRGFGGHVLFDCSVGDDKRAERNSYCEPVFGEASSLETVLDAALQELLKFKGCFSKIEIIEEPIVYEDGSVAYESELYDWFWD